jgi:hypothetical protein
MGTTGKAGNQFKPSNWKSLAGANINSYADAMAKTVNTAVNDTLQGSKRKYFMAQGGIAGGDWRDNMRASGLR